MMSELPLGDLDPGLVWYWPGPRASMRNESGLPGVSETSSDMGDVLDQESQDVRAAEAIALFCDHVKKWIGPFAAALGGLDTWCSLVASENTRPRSGSGFAMGWIFLGLTSRQDAMRRMRTSFPPGTDESRSASFIRTKNG